MPQASADPQPDIKDRLRFESVLAEISSRFVNLPPAEVDHEIEGAQRRVCECLGLDLSSLWQWDAEAPLRLTMTHLYRSTDDPPIPEKMNAENFFPWCQEQLVAGRVLVGETLDVFPPEAALDREMSALFDLKSFLTFPLRVGGGGPVGALSFNTTKEERTWPDEIVQRLGLVAQVIANALDRKQSDELLTESEERFSLAADSAGVGMWMLDVEGGRFWANERGRSLFEFEPEADVTMEAVLKRVHGEDRERVLEAVKDAIESSSEIDIEYRTTLMDGKVRWIHSRGRMQTASPTSPKQLQGASVDVTDRKLAEETLNAQLHFETMLAELSARFITASGEEVEPLIDHALEKVGLFCECDRCGLLQVHEDPPRMYAIHAWYNDGIDEVPAEINLVEWWPWWHETAVRRGKAFSIDSLDDLPPEAEQDRLTFEKIGTKSVIVVPLTAPDGVRWLFTVSTLHRETSWDPELISRLRLLGDVLLNALERQRKDESLAGAYAQVDQLRQQLELENTYLKREYQLQRGSGRIVGESPAIMAVLGLAEQVAPTGTTVLIEGDTGTGKELIAQRVHELSDRAERPMVKVNCAALPSTLVESELFGREKGAYTGSVSREPGRFEVANRSTLFLDEISELPLELQAKLLRVLEEGQYERVGSSKTLQTDVRVIAATNRDLQVEVEEGRFRRDLYFRLAVFPIRVPPLTERRGDIPLLVWSAVEEFSASMHKSVETIRREDLERLQNHEWTGNVRELRNVVERAMIMCSGPVLKIEVSGGVTSGNGPVLSLDEAQRRQIMMALEMAGGKISGTGGAAELLGLKPTTLRSKMDRLDLDPKSMRDGRFLV